MDFYTILGFVFGGVLFGSTAFFMIYTTDKVFGVSGFVESCLYPVSIDASWKGLFLIGMITGAIILKFIHPIALDIHLDRSLPYVFLGGCLVGFGTRLGCGCTSGHGLSGVGRLRPRSIVATLIFIGVGIATATILGRFQ
jgi:hypothetical protein